MTSDNKAVVVFLIQKEAVVSEWVRWGDYSQNGHLVELAGTLDRYCYVVFYAFFFFTSV